MNNRELPKEALYHRIAELESELAHLKTEKAHLSPGKQRKYLARFLVLCAVIVAFLTIKYDGGVTYFVIFFVLLIWLSYRPQSL